MLSSPLVPPGSDPEIGAAPASPVRPAREGDRDGELTRMFRTGDLVQVFTDSVVALARIRESSDAGRLHIAFEMGEYLPWVDAAVLIRHAAQGSPGSDPSRPARAGAAARILHAGTSTALLQLLHAVEELPSGREPFDTLPLLVD